MLSSQRVNIKRSFRCVNITKARIVVLRYRRGASGSAPSWETLSSRASLEERLKPPLLLQRRPSRDVMRQLKGKPKKETSKDKRERKQAMQDARRQVATVVLPTVAVVVLLIVFFVYAATRPGAIA